MVLRYVPPIKKGALIMTFISFFLAALVLYVAFVQWGFWAIVVFTLIYALYMIFHFYTLSAKHYIELDEENEKVLIFRRYKRTELLIKDINSIELLEKKRSYLLSITANKKTYDCALSGSLSFEEPPVVPFLKKIQQTKNTISLGNYCIAILQGKSTFNPWSSKMYFSYWVYISITIVYYLLLLLFINTFK